MSRRTTPLLRTATLALTVLLATASPVLAAPHATPASPAGTATAASPSLKLRADLADLVAGAATLDPRIGALVPGLREGELPYFVVLDAPNDAARRATLEGLGARVLRSYRSVTAFAVVSEPVTVLRIAALPEVAWLAPVELVVALADEPLADQQRGTPGDVGADALWEDGITGDGVRIAILDTGLDRAHPDVDDLDFRHWSAPLGAAKVVDARDFNGGGCNPMLADGHGHGTHVAAIAAGTGEGTPLTDDDGRHAGIAPGAELAIGKVLTDAGAGINSDLIAAMEWAAMPADPAGCAIGADIVNLSLGSEARPGRLNSDSDVDLVSLVLNRLAVRYGTLFTAAAGNSGPFIGSVLEAPGSAAQALSVAAAAKDWDVDHDDTASGDTCAGYRHPASSSPGNPCDLGTGDQGPSLSAFSSRGPSGDVWLRPDVAAPGYNIVSAQASTGAALAQNDLNRGTRADPLYATASGTSMAAPATAGSAALLLEAYRDAHGADPSGASGVSDLAAPAYVLLRAALMNSAGGDLAESRWILTTDSGTRVECPDPDPLFGLCRIVTIFTDFANGSLVLYEVRNGADDPYVGPLGEGAGKIQVERAASALRDGIVIYSAATAGTAAGTGHRDFQGSWQIGAATAGTGVTQQFVVHAAPGAGTSVSFAFEPGNPSDGSHAIPVAGTEAWAVTLPGPTVVPGGGDAVVSFGLSIPSGAPAGAYTGIVRATTSDGQVLRIPVLASVALHDPDPAAGNAPGPQATVASARDVYGKGDTTWPSAVGAAGTGASADWLVYPVDLAADLSAVTFRAHDAAAGDETYDLYLYDADLDLAASTHPFAAPGVTDQVANGSRGPSTAAAPQALTVRTPAAGRHYLVVNRARIGGTTTGDMGAFVLAVDEVRGATSPAATALTYDGDRIFVQGETGILAATLVDAAGAPIAGRTVTFTLADGAPCPGGCSAVTDYAGRAMVATDPIATPAGLTEVSATFAGDAHWQAATERVPAVVVGASLPPLPGGGGRVTAGGWLAAPSGASADRVHAAFHATSDLPAPSGELRWLDRQAGVDLTLVAYRSLTVSGTDATLSGTGRLADGRSVSFVLTAGDRGEPGRGTDTLRLQILETGYDRAGTLGGGNVQLHRS
ncbi:MAG TPA: S8 family serine peptidase [Candidatus Limnocylindria bacterium]|nr:S8 family serine peptidase [Candidatus Limnocylindria bacterium]